MLVFQCIDIQVIDRLNANIALVVDRLCIATILDVVRANRIERLEVLNAKTSLNRCYNEGSKLHLSRAIRPTGVD